MLIFGASFVAIRLFALAPPSETDYFLHQLDFFFLFLFFFFFFLFLLLLLILLLLVIFQQLETTGCTWRTDGTSWRWFDVHRRFNETSHGNNATNDTPRA
jgi:hypothetical protein